MWIDTHCHLDAGEFGREQPQIAQDAAQRAVDWIVIPAVDVGNFSVVADLSRQHGNCVYALGIHPIFVPAAGESDLQTLRSEVEKAMDDKRFVAIGEIGLDFFIPQLTRADMREKQEHFYREQLKIARDFDLPVLLHVRRSQDIILKHLRRIAVKGGIAHAFNGSFQQAQAFIDLGFKLGFGGAMTFPRSLQIRRLATQLPAEVLVLETDAPDISPVWLHPERNSPAELPRIGETLAQLRETPVEEMARQTFSNSCQALPRLSSLIH